MASMNSATATSTTTSAVSTIALCFLSAVSAGLTTVWILRRTGECSGKPTKQQRSADTCVAPTTTTKRLLRDDIVTSREEVDSTEKQKMLSGQLYNAGDDQLCRDRAFAHRAMFVYNNEIVGGGGDNDEARRLIMARVLGQHSTKFPPHIEPPFQCDYGYNISIGERFYANFGCVMLDCNTIKIGDDVKFGPNVHVYTAGHPLEPSVRNFKPSGQGLEFAYPIVIGNSVWIGGGVIILPGVSIGNNVVVGAGAVVTKNIPDNCIAAGVPARVVKTLQINQ